MTKKFKDSDLAINISAISIGVLLFNNTIQGITFLGFTLPQESINIIAIITLFGGIGWHFFTK